MTGAGRNQSYCSGMKFRTIACCIVYNMFIIVMIYSIAIGAGSNVLYVAVKGRHMQYVSNRTATAIGSSVMLKCAASTTLYV